MSEERTRRLGSSGMSEEEADGRASELRSYLWGYGLALALTLVPFGLVVWGVLARTAVYWVLGVFALVQIVVHFRFFLHIDVSKQKREDLQLILFSTLILALMVGGTLWIMYNLYLRMMQ